jgi:hypothetical protein
MSIAMKMVACVVIVCALALGAAGGTQKITLASAFEPYTTSIDGSQPSYVQHGFLEVPAEGEKPKEMRDKLLEQYAFYLEIDGEWIQPTSVTVTKAPPSRNNYGVDGWRLSSTFRLPASSLSEGVHTFTGIWIGPDPEDTDSWTVLLRRDREIEVVYP